MRARLPAGADADAAGATAGLGAGAADAAGAAAALVAPLPLLYMHAPAALNGALAGGTGLAASVPRARFFPTVLMFSFVAGRAFGRVVQGA